MLLTGREAETIASLCGAAKESGGYVLERERVEELFHRARTLSAEAAAQEFGLPQEAAGAAAAVAGHLFKNDGGGRDTAY